jgi:hypothetical protein
LVANFWWKGEILWVGGRELMGDMGLLGISEVRFEGRVGVGIISIYKTVILPRHIIDTREISRLEIFI